MNPFTVHTAGPPVALKQRCVRCGFVLQDGQPWADGNVMVAVSAAGPHDPQSPGWWPTGARIGTDKDPATPGQMSCTYTLPEDRPLDEDEVLCDAVNQN